MEEFLRIAGETCFPGTRFIFRGEHDADRTTADSE